MQVDGSLQIISDCHSIRKTVCNVPTKYNCPFWDYVRSCARHFFLFSNIAALSSVPGVPHWVSAFRSLARPVRSDNYLRPWRSAQYLRPDIGKIAFVFCDIIYAYLNVRVLTYSRHWILFVTVHPVISSPSQLVGAPKGTEVTLECNVEAFPKSINYWVRESGKSRFTSPPCVYQMRIYLYAVVQPNRKCRRFYTYRPTCSRTISYVSWNTRPFQNDWHRKNKSRPAYIKRLEKS